MFGSQRMQCFFTEVDGSWEWPRFLCELEFADEPVRGGRVQQIGKTRRIGVD